MRARPSALYGLASLLASSLLLIVLLPHAARAQALASASPDARRVACTRGLPALPFQSRRPHALAEGAAAAELVLGCAEAGGVASLEVSGAEASAWAELAAAARARGVRISRLEHSARAAARAGRLAAGSARYDVIVLSPDDAPAERSPLWALQPKLSSLTVEGLHELFGALSSEGVIVAFLSSETSALRFAMTAMEASRRQGVARPSSRIVVQQVRDHYAVLVGAGPIEMEVLLELHERDRLRREGTTRGPAGAATGWTTAPPTLIHTPVATFPNHFSGLLVRSGAPTPDGAIPDYVFDIAPVRDDRPLFFEQTRRDRPDTWTSRGTYERAIELSSIALGLLILGGGVALFTLRRAVERGALLGAGALLLGLTHGATLTWSLQATSRLLADARMGVLLGAGGWLVGAAVGVAASHAAFSHRRTLVVAATALLFVSLAPVAWHWSAWSDALPYASARLAGVTASFVVGAVASLPLGWLWQRLGNANASASARARVLAAACLTGALLASAALSSATVLFADFRALGALSAVSGALAALLCGLGRPRANG